MIALPKLPVLKPRERLLAAGSGLVLLVVVLDRLVLNPWLRHSQTIRRETRRMEQALQHNDRLLTRRNVIAAQLRTYKRYLHPPVADELQMAVLLKEIEGLAERSQIQLGEIKPLAAESDEFSKKFSLDVQFECTLEEWVDFITQLESSPSLFQIVRASLSSQEETPDRLKASLRVVSVTPQTVSGSVEAQQATAKP
jgi:Tfp pilus assembly protein PilO